MGFTDWFNNITGRDGDPDRLLEKAIRQYDAEKYTEAAETLGRSAELGNAAAQNNLGYMYETGRGVPRDIEKAADLYGKAADQGYTAAMFNLALCKYRYEEVRDYDRAFVLFKAAYDRSLKECAYYLGQCYLNGYGTDRDAEEGLRLLRVASDSSRTEDDPEERFKAPLLLAQVYDRGDIVERNEDLAVKWYEIAAIRGSKCAEDRLKELGAE